ncbi:MAG: GH3 auxin-responsive promoter family protein [Clostridia bacterium]|nr:GH3 auxin-responsive promoter family protein [Clostridia bacterium]
MNRKIVQMFASYGAFIGGVEHKKLGLYAARANKVQHRVLSDLMRVNKDTEYGRKYGFADIKTVEEYQDRVPLTTYSDYAPYVERMLNGEKKVLTKYHISRFSESSGSVGRPKVIPLSARTLWVLQCFSFSAPVGCAAKWFREKGMSMPPQRGLLTIEITSHRAPNGKTVSCLSGIPLMYLKPIIKFFATSPEEIMFPKDTGNMDMHYLKLRFALPDRDVSYLGTMIITVLETMFEYLENNWEMMCDDIEKGTINESIACPPDVRASLLKKIKPDPVRAEELRREFRKGFDTPIVPRIWPAVGWVYGMGASSLSVYGDRLKRYTGDLPVHHMGYGASEAYMAVPLELNSDDNVMLPENGFYEFLPVDAPEGTRPLTIDQLEIGKDYELILTNICGLYRYRIEDVLRVTGFHGESPVVRFMYRLNQVLNIAGEKTTQKMVDHCAIETAKQFGFELAGYSVYADLSTTPGHYVLFIEPKTDVDIAKADEMAKVFDDFLDKANLFISDAKGTGTLGDTEVKILKSGTYEQYRQSLKANGANLNQVKPVRVLNSPEKLAFFSERVLEEEMK